MALSVQRETAVSPNGTRARSTTHATTFSESTLSPPNPSNKKTQTSPDGPNGSSWDSVFKFIANIGAPVLGYGTLISGVGAFIYNGLMQKESKLVDIASTLLSKGSLLGSGLAGFIHNKNEKNLPATIGYSLDVLNPLLVSSKYQYLGRAPATALDQLPAMVKEIQSKYKNEIDEKFNKKKDPKYNFNEFTSFWDSIDKTFFSAKVILKKSFSEISKTFKEKGFTEATKDFFAKKRAELNLLTSSIGCVVGGGLAGIGLLKNNKMLENAGKFIRDVEGWHADYGVYLKKHSVDPITGKPTGTGNNMYANAAYSYFAAGGFDLLAMPFSKYGFHYLANAFDRFGGLLMVEAQREDGKKANEL